MEEDTEDDWENEGGMALPYVDDNTSREELDEATRMPMSAPIFLQEKSVEPAPCSRTALVRDRYIDDIKSGLKGKTFEKVDPDVWAKVVQRMRDKEKGVPRRRKDDK